MPNDCILVGSKNYNFNLKIGALLIYIVNLLGKIVITYSG